MVIRDENNFVKMVAKMIEGLDYQNVHMQEGKSSAIDITADKDGETYCFKCQYDIDAVGAGKVQALIDEYKSSNYDKAVFVTNSSFISAAKKVSEENGIILWDRNTIDRLYVGVSEPLEETVHEKASGGYGVLIAVIAVIVLIAAAAIYYFFFR